MRHTWIAWHAIMSKALNDCKMYCRLLKESLGGNSKTAMLATIGPSNSHIDETLSTLRYAKQARSIINQARVNEDPKARLIRGKL